MDTKDILVSLLLVFSQYSARSHTLLNLNETLSEIGNSDETLQNLFWVPIKSDWLPNNTVGIYNHYSSRQEYVCRARDYCTFGVLSLGKGHLCFFPFLEEEAHTDNFDVLVNKNNFELLEWKSEASDPGITFCQNNFVGKNKYGLGDVYNGHFYLPWEGSSYKYSHYDVLTVNHEPYQMHYSDVKYFFDQAKRTTGPPYAMKVSQVINQGNEEVTDDVLMEVTIGKASEWECGLDLSHSSSTSITAGIPDFLSDKITLCLDVTVSLEDGRSVNQPVTLSQRVQVQVPPGHSCVVKMMGRKIEVNIPFQARVTKTYEDGPPHDCTVTGVYTGVHVGETIMKVDVCEPLPDGTTQKT